MLVGRLAEKGRLLKYANFGRVRVCCRLRTASRRQDLFDPADFRRAFLVSAYRCGARDDARAASCLQHVREIKSALGISGVVTNDCSWQVVRTSEHEGAQVDLLVDRKDGVVNLCEMKFASAEYAIGDEEERRLRERRDLFRRVTGTRKAVHMTYVTTCGLRRNVHAGTVQSEVTLEDLFQKGVR